MNLYSLFKKGAFQLDAEFAHDVTLKMLSMNLPFLGKSLSLPSNHQLKLAISCGGVEFKSPIGVAAGLDKDARCIDFFAQTCFGGLEVGTVTPLAQKGNSKPRLKRLPEKNSLWNAMGFNNQGRDVVLKNVQKRENKKYPLGVNIGKNKMTPNDKAISDYLDLYHTFWKDAQYIVINVSSPNTEKLRDLQHGSFLKELFTEISCNKKSVPLFVKIAPDLTFPEIEQIVQLCSDFSLNGIVATNTSNRHSEASHGGVSGEMIKEKARRIRNELLKMTHMTSLDVIGVGGMSQLEDFLEFWSLGGKYCQVYSSLIFQGPWYFKNLLTEVLQLMEKHNCQTFPTFLQHLRQKSTSDRTREVSL